MSQKFYSDIEARAGLMDSSGALGTSGQILSSTGSNVSWINQSTAANDVQNRVKAGVAINKGQAVYVTGADGTNIIVGLASNASEATSSKTLGLLNATVAINGMADVVQIGRLSGLNTLGATAGDPVWLGTGGNLIYGLIGKPYAPANLVFIGIVTRVNVSNGEIFVNVQNGFELNEIHDVDLKTNVPINGDVLGFNGTLWVNKTIAGWLGYTPANASGTTNYVSKFTGTTTLGNSLLFDNGTNVGIGTTSPTEKLVVGNLGGGVKRIYVPGTYNFDGSYLSNYDGNGGGKLELVAHTGVSNSASWRIANNNDTYGQSLTFSYAPNTTSYSALSYSAPAMLIANTGNVGIGTSSPTRKLDVAGLSMFNGAQLRSTDDGSTLVGFVGNRSAWTGGSLDNNLSVAAYTSNICFFTNNSVGESMRITSTGNVGIGTSTPNRLLTVAGTTSGLIALNSSSYRNTTIGSDSVGNFIVYDDTAGAYRMVINSSGNVGIGTTNPEVSLDVVGINGGTAQSRVRSTSGGDIRISVDTVGRVGTYSNSDLLVLTNSSERMRITSTGNVGIGTTSPAYKTQIESSGADVFLSKNTSSTSFNRSYFYNNNNVGVQFLNFGSAYPFGTEFGVGQNGSVIQSNTTSMFAIGTSGAYPLVLGTSGTERMRITSSGNVGIGTSSPSYKLQVNDTIATVTGFGSFTASQSAAGTGFRWTLNNDGTFRVQKTADGFFNISATPIMIDSSNRVGIGTTAPQRDLQVGAFSGSPEICIGSSTSGNGTLAFGDGASGNDPWRGYVQYNHSVDAMIFGTVNGEKVRITSAGYMGIGTTAPGVRFVNSGGGLSSGPTLGSGVIGSQALLSNDGLYGMYSGVSSNGDVWHQVQRNDANATVYNLALQPSGGAIYLGTTAPIYGTAAKLQILFDGLSVFGMNFKSTAVNSIPIHFTSSTGTQTGYIFQDATSVFLVSVSDYRLKEDLNSFSGLDLISKINVYDYKWKNQDKRSFGVMAHELQEIVPQAAFGEKDGERMQGVDYSTLVPILIQAIKEQQTQIEELKILINK